ncbi:hypothetical protein BXZ70DRAFT_60827 [Cristinia sonorae]|uniref:DUF6533 domain-containing protein n=1 Tax=Cristinia sonorae TaxID=1940300 RepID=A0A8K0XR98_9AGAR|nr:hypothetical protein BXZ70DRAFT_60827 [Cristinia sonorae]
MDDFAAGVQRWRIKTSTRLAPATILAYDFLLTLDSEVNLMWPSKLSITKLLYFYTRYSAFVDVALMMYYQLEPDISPETCKRLYILSSWLIVVGIILAEVILMLRTWAIWGRGKKIGIVLVLLSVSATVAACTIEGLFLKTLTFTTFPGTSVPGCLLTGGNTTVGVNFVIIILIETAVLLLTLTGGVQRFRVMRQRHGLASVLYRDGILFYVYLFVISILNFVVILTLPQYSGDLLTGIQRVLHSCLSARVLTNLRQASLRTERATALNSIPLPSTIRFAALAGTDSAESSGQSRNDGDRNGVS